MYNFPKAISLIQKEKRISKVFGKTFMENAISIEMEANGIKLWGWVSLPSLERRQSDWQYFYLNGRPIRDRLVQHAIRQAYSDRIDTNFQPSYILYLIIEPDVVDVNVHPTKSEVRFRDSRYVHDFIVNCLRQVLSQTNSGISIASYENQLKVQEEYKKASPKLASKTYEINKKEYFPLGDIIGLLKKRFVLSENNNGLIIIDLKELYVQLFYLDIQNLQIKNNMKSLVIPETLIFDNKKAKIIENSLFLLKDFGIYLEILSKNTFVVRKAHSIYEDIKFDLLLEDIFLSIGHDYEKDLLKKLVVNAVAKQFNNDKFSKINDIERAMRGLEKSGCYHTSYRGNKIWGVFSLTRIVEIL
ncbi:MAG: hypothetical protein HRT87_00005 [Legionellales bacterium]|nr:hypothetical protein [Legionellales bacterium]